MSQEFQVAMSHAIVIEEDESPGQVDPQEFTNSCNENVKKKLEFIVSLLCKWIAIPSLNKRFKFSD